MSLPVNQGRFGDQFRNLFGIKGHVGLNLLNDIMPVMDVQGEQPEELYTRDEILGMGNASIAPVAAQVGVFVVENANSDRLVIVERCQVACVSQVELGINRTSFYGGLVGAPQSMGVRDARAWSRGGNTQIGSTIRSGATAGWYGTAVQEWIDFATSPGVRDVLCPWIIPPGWGFTLWCLTANTAMNVSVGVRERHLDSIT